MAARSSNRLFWMCPKCECAWESPPIEFDRNAIRSPALLAPDGHAPATEAQLRSIDERAMAKPIELDESDAQALYLDARTLAVSNLDYEWVAFDEDGHLGIFSTAGGGPVPHWFLEHKLTFEWFMDRLHELPDRGTHRFVTNVSWREDRRMRETDGPIADTADARKHYADWVRWARMGMYAFDWDGLARLRKYELIAAPVNPLRWPNDEPAPTWCSLDGVRFAQESSVVIRTWPDGS